MGIKSAGRLTQRWMPSGRTDQVRSLAGLPLEMAPEESDVADDAAAEQKVELQWT